MEKLPKPKSPPKEKPIVKRETIAFDPFERPKPPVYKPDEYDQS